MTVSYKELAIFNTRKITEYEYKKLVLRSHHKNDPRVSDREEEAQISTQSKIRVPRIAFGLVPLTTPYDESDPELRILNTIKRGLLYETTKTVAEELKMSKLEYNRILRSLKNSGEIYVTPEGKFKLTFDTSNFPNIITREDDW